MLGAIPKRIGPDPEPVELKPGAVVCEVGGLLKHAYVSWGTVFSLSTVLEDGSAIDSANIGREGAFGRFAAMYISVPFNRRPVQIEIEGGMVRRPIEMLQSDFRSGEDACDLFVS